MILYTYLVIIVTLSKIIVNYLIFKDEIFQDVNERNAYLLLYASISDFLLIISVMNLFSPNF